jgi:hypothetical protein
MGEGHGILAYRKAGCSWKMNGGTNGVPPDKKITWAIHIVHDFLYNICARSVKCYNAIGTFLPISTCQLIRYLLNEHTYATDSLRASRNEDSIFYF